MPKNFTAPEFQKTAFNCSHCGAYAEQKWAVLHYFDGGLSSDKANAIFFFKNFLREYYDRGSYYIPNARMEE